MKGAALTVVVALLVAVACQPAQAVTKTVLAEHRLEDGRRFTVPYCVIGSEYVHIETVTSTARIVGDNLAPPSFERSAGEMEQTASLLNRMINNTELFFRGFRDVATPVTRTVFAGESNLRDPVARYDFWKEQGIYEKYTPRERQFLNRVVFPAVAVGEIALGGCGALLTAGAITVGFGLSAAAALPVALILGATWAGITAYKAYRVQNDNAEVVRDNPFQPYGGYQNALNGLLGVGGLVSFAAGSSVIPVFAASEGAIGTAALATAYGVGMQGLGGVGLMYHSSEKLTNLANIWGIPEEKAVTEVKVKKRRFREPDEYGAYEIEMRFSLTK